MMNVPTGNTGDQKEDKNYDGVLMTLARTLLRLSGFGFHDSLVEITLTPSILIPITLFVKNDTCFYPVKYA